MMNTYMTNGESMAYGVIRGDVPFAGEFRDANGIRDITGSIHWKTSMPDSNPDEGKMDVILFLFVDDEGIETPKGKLRLECSLVTQLMAKSREAGDLLLKMVLERIKGPERYSVQCTQ